MMDGSMKPYLIVILIQLIYAGMYVISKAALDTGLSSFLFVFYRQAAATILLAPLALIFERKNAPALSFMLAFKVFMHALLGITWSLNLYNVALSYTSATVASATTNSVPVFTFLLAILFRMESIRLKSISGLAKLLGISLCVAGIMIIALYQGPGLNSINHHHLLGHGTSSNNHAPTHSNATWIKGSFLMITANTSWSLWLVLQAVVLKDYPSKLLLTTLQCAFSTIQSFFVALAFERDMARWKLRLDTGLIAVAYCGFVVTGVSFYLQTWCIEMKGPVFLAMATPLAMVFTILCSLFFLGEIISFGSVLGGILMVGGLYSVLWAKSKETSACKPSIEDRRECTEEKEVASPSLPV